MGVKHLGSSVPRCGVGSSNDSGALRESGQPSPRLTGEIQGGVMIQNPTPKSTRYICGKCKTVFSPYGDKMRAQCPKCGSLDIQEEIKIKTEVVQK